MIEVKAFSLGMGTIVCNGCDTPHEVVNEISEVHGISYGKVLYLCNGCYKEYDKQHEVQAHL